MSVLNSRHLICRDVRCSHAFRRVNQKGRITEELDLKAKSDSEGGKWPQKLNIDKANEPKLREATEEDDPSRSTCRSRKQSSL